MPTVCRTLNEVNLERNIFNHGMKIQIVSFVLLCHATFSLPLDTLPHLYRYIKDEEYHIIINLGNRN